MAKKGMKWPEFDHSVPHTEDKIPAVFPAIDNDLAAENLTDHFDMTAADLQDLQ